MCAAAQVAAGMIKERRLGGSIDQQEQFISFEDSRESRSRAPPPPPPPRAD
jgi:hypothetical protein